REQLEVGDQIYWPWKGTYYCPKRKCQVEYAPGHVVTYAGNGLVLENSNMPADKRLAAGARQPVRGAACVFL
ncbi:hypothetical protein ACP3WD_25325, partial [Salmonella enterica]|uniref:hypothetical protein n=1 Tax=Salmonella enterica TaxID=28901 RepID=UPI003CECC2C2